MHPELYILIIPAFGAVSHIVSHFSGKDIFGFENHKYTGLVNEPPKIGDPTPKRHRCPQDCSDPTM
jgi:hypothetical protein